MNDMELIIRALKLEAQQKPNERIFVGFKSYTYAEFAKMLNDHKKLNKTDKQFIKSFLDTSLKLFKENPTYRQRILKLAGE
jgi:ClpP class serine protease